MLYFANQISDMQFKGKLRIQQIIITANLFGFNTCAQ